MTISGKTTIGEALIYATNDLKEAGIPSPRLDSEVLLSHTLSCSRVDLLLNGNQLLSESNALVYQEQIKRRKIHEPVSYITGIKEFMSLPFSVQEGILIPRPETELLVEMMIAQFQNVSRVHMLDLCTGSGAIAVSLAYYLKCASVVAVDKFDICVETTAKNALKHNVHERVRVVQADILSEFLFADMFDCIVSNPPYVTQKEMEALPIDVKNYEPDYALDGGSDGLVFYRRIADIACDKLKIGGRLYFEIGYEQGGTVKQILENKGCFTDIKVTKDYAGLNRIVSAVRGEL